MRKLAKGFCFCADKYRFRAAEAIIKIALELDQKKKSQVLMLTDNILNRLEELTIETDLKKKIDKQTCTEFKKLMLPSEGLNIADKYLKQQQKRLQNAKNKNHLISFSFDPIMLSVILKLLYKQENGKFKLNFITRNLAYIVGTPGLGKSIKFIAAKILLDYRIPEIIKNGLEESSIFSQNYKIMYFHIQTPEKQIMQKILQEVKNDFDHVPEEISQVSADEQNFEKFISQVSNAYKNKKVGLRLIIDQINSVYKLIEPERKKQIDKWRQICKKFVRPAIMISSKNNPYLENYDPVIYFANSFDNDVKHNKVILDNLITPNQRLNYSYSCLAFELEKYINRDDTIKILQNISLPISTHLSVTNAVRNALSKFQYLGSINTSEVSKICQAIQKELNSFQFLQNFHKMLKQIEPKKLQQYLETISQFLSFSCKDALKEKIILVSCIKQKSGEMKIVKKMKIPKKELQGGQKYYHLKQLNYFFLTERDKKQYIMICTSVQKMEQVIMEIMSHVSKKYLQDLRNVNEDLFKNFIRYNTGQMFEGYICYLYKIGLKDDNSVTTRISFLKNLPAITHEAKTMSSDLFSIDEQQSYKVLFQKKNQFIKCSIGNAAFDFVLTQCSTNKKRLFLVDTTISSEFEPILEKLSKFKRILFEKKIKSQETNFRNQILNQLKSDNKCEIQILCFVLTATSSKAQFEILSNEQLQEQEEKILKKLQQRSLNQTQKKEIKDINKDIQNIIKGRQNFNCFQAQLQKQSLDKKFKILFMQGDRFMMNSKKYSRQLMNEINQFPKYLIKSKKDANE